MDDLISRALALEVINAVKGVTWSQSGKVLCGKMFSQIKDLPAVKAVPVVFCKDCEYCQPLYCKPDGTAASDGSFRCGDTEIEYYAPDYNMDSYFCADGKRRDEPCT